MSSWTSPPYTRLPTDATTRTRIFFWFTSDALLKRHTRAFYQGGLWAKVVPKRTTYCISWGVSQRVPSSVSASRLRSDPLSWEKTLRNPEEQRWPWERDVVQSAPTHARHNHSAFRQLGTTVDWRYDVPWDWLQDACQMARVHWGTCCEGFCSKEGPHYRFEWSARNQLECDQVQRALEKSSRSCCQTSNNQPWFTSLEIPWGFLSWAVLRWLSVGLCHAKKCQFKDCMWEEYVWFAIAQLTFAWETFGKRWNGEIIPVLRILAPGSHKRLPSRKRVMCARNMEMHVQRGNWRTKGIKNEMRIWIPVQPRKARRN